MNNSKQYVIIGAFVIFTLTAMIFIGVWLAFGLSNVKYSTFIAVFNESVDGLQLNSDVKFNGVSVGKVSAITINNKNPSDVDVELQIQEGTPVTTYTYATLMAQGITGLSYIGLQTKYHKPPIQLLSSTESPPYTSITTKPSIFSNITQQIDNVSNEIGAISTSTSKLINDKNSKTIIDIINNIDTFTGTFASNNKNIEDSIKSLSITLNNLSESSSKFNVTINNINDTAKSISIVAAEVAKIAKSFQSQTLQGINQVVIPEAYESLKNINTATIQLNELLQSINNNPSILVTGELAPEPGPGE
ncbi:MAG: phospholipid/cholesterol/gamma-HCH transport system substrate-binding protein [Francisellaceae bacterium]|jgi:phospholipid/cholesterol/gamma-HCH transport system substrate-binding protein